jgi:hypothetical protein
MKKTKEPHLTRPASRLTCQSCVYSVGWDSVVGIGTRYGLDGPEIKSWGGEIFHTCSDQPWGPSSFLHNRYHVSFLGEKWPGHGVDCLPLASTKVKERVELYLCLPPWAFMAGYRVNFIFTFICTVQDIVSS